MTQIWRSWRLWRKKNVQISFWGLLLCATYSIHLETTMMMLRSGISIGLVSATLKRMWSWKKKSGCQTFTYCFIVEKDNVLAIKYTKAGGAAGTAAREKQKENQSMRITQDKQTGTYYFLRDPVVLVSLVMNPAAIYWMFSPNFPPAIISDGLYIIALGKLAFPLVTITTLRNSFIWNDGFMPFRSNCVNNKNWQPFFFTARCYWIIGPVWIWHLHPGRNSISTFLVYNNNNLGWNSHIREHPL